MFRINQFQFIASHNRYRLKSYAPLFNYWSSIKHPILKALMQHSLDYSNDETFDEQFSEYGLRGLEIDIYYDPQGGRYYNRKANKLINEPVAWGIDALKKPGFKVMHVPDFDCMTYYITFIDALTAVKNWSDKNPEHFPIFIMIDAKEQHMVEKVKKKYCTSVLKLTKNAVDSIDLEIEQVFGKNSEKIITPDLVRGNYKTLNEAILNNSWPLLSEARGKIIFIIAASTEAKMAYLENHYSLKNRTMFLFTSPGKPESAFINKDNPVDEFENIQNWTKQGYIIRTRADERTTEARKGNYKRYYKALESGAQMIATDYYKADERHITSKKWSNYHIQFTEKNVARLNQINTNNSTNLEIHIRD